MDLAVKFLEQVLRVRIITEDIGDAIPNNDMHKVRAWARSYVNRVYEDAEYWEFSEMKRVDARTVDVLFYYME